MLRLGETNFMVKTNYFFLGGGRGGVNVDNIVISNLIHAKNNSRYLTGYLEEARRPIVLILTKMRYLKAFKPFKVKDGDKNNKLMSFCINDDKLLESIKPFGLRLRT